jgi:uncharacterized protein YndB with AHSA1/START domain
MATELITVSTEIHAPIDQVWNKFNDPAHITKWCFASEDWHAPAAENNLTVGGSFKTSMAAKDGSFAFDFGGVYTNIIPFELIEYTLEDGRKVKIVFEKTKGTVITEMFEPEQTNPLEMQKSGWQAILDNFRNYVEHK